MAERAAGFGVQFRPHFKTHQSRAVGRLFRAQGIERITVSSVEMALYFADDGWRDITIAYPLSWREARDLAVLPPDCVVRSAGESARSLHDIDAVLQREVGVFLKVDTGYGRTGIAWDDTVAADEVLRAIESSPRLRFDGVLTHAGTTYGAAGPEDVVARHAASSARLVSLARRYRPSYPELVASVGDTPGCSLAAPPSGVDEWRPGNFVFYDLMQVALGACAVEDIAVAVRCTVSAVHEHRGTFVLHCGAVHLSKDNIHDAHGPCFGLVAPHASDGW
jgi:D-serine deaminase-like pyridoxal phosphate-dependent protein